MNVKWACCVFTLFCNLSETRWYFDAQASISMPPSAAITEFDPPVTWTLTSRPWKHKQIISRRWYWIIICALFCQITSSRSGQPMHEFLLVVNCNHSSIYFAESLWYQKVTLKRLLRHRRLLYKLDSSRVISYLSVTQCSHGLRKKGPSCLPHNIAKVQ